MQHQLLILLIILDLRVFSCHLGLRPHTQNSNPLDSDARVILKRALHLKDAIDIAKVNLGDFILHLRQAIIKVKLATSGAIQAWCNDDIESLLAQRSRGVRALDALWVDETALIVHRDMGDVDFGGDVLAVSADGLASSPFIEDVVREVVGNTGAVFLRDRRDKDAGAIEELEIDAVSVLVGGVVEEERVKGWCASLGLLVDGCVNVVN